LIVGAIGIVVCVLGAILDPDQFFRSYLMAYLFWFGLALGGLPLIMLHHMVGGAWGLVIRRTLEAATRTLPLMALLFLPVLFGVHSLYEWARPEAVAASELLQHKAPYLNVAFWRVRAVVYFAIWIGLALRLNAWSQEQDRTGDVGLARKMQVLSAPGVIFYFLAMTFAAIDWVMSLDPYWFSSILGPLLMVGQVLNAFAFAIVMVFLMSAHRPLADVVRPDVFHDLGKLLLAFVMVWAYFSFSQYLIIWAGNLPEEIRWYMYHSSGGWFWMGLAIIALHFFVPFFVLLSRDLKRNPRVLARVAAGILVMRQIEIFWTVTPVFHPEHLAVHWLDLAAPAGIGGLWLWVFLSQLKAQPVLPLHDPFMKEAFESGGH
ncbi:MAG: hypothetical protein ACREQQ_14980, partial [Candidatus Binatia bacterium]